MRAEFSEKVRHALAEATGFMCSFPGCPATTIGPSDEGPGKSNRTGMACHIAAASGGPGARRVVPSMTKEQLSHIDNGIWMCYTHGKQIDADEIRFTIPMLKTWRQVAELRQRLRQDLGKEVHFGPEFPARVPLATNDITISGLGAESSLLGEAIQDSCVGEIWGSEIAHAARDLAIEVVRNAFTHGGASTFKLAIDGGRIVLSDNGQRFSVQSLLTHPSRRGGGEAFRQFLDRHKHRVVVSSRYAGGSNETVLALIHEPGDVARVTPCAVELNGREFYAEGFTIPIIEDCETIYVVMPPFASYSDAYVLIERLTQQGHDGRRVVFVGRQISPGVISALEKELPGCRVMSL